MRICSPTSHASARHHDPVLPLAQRAQSTSRAGAVCRGGEVRLWSRNGKDFTAKFPDVQKALTAQVEVDCLLDGELVVWTGDRMDFDALQQRNVNTAATVRVKLAPAQPASFVVFDVLALDTTRNQPRRKRPVLASRRSCCNDFSGARWAYPVGELLVNGLCDPRCRSRVEP